MISDGVAERNALTKLASRLLATGQPVRAFRVAERLCRAYQRPDPRHFLLRAQAALDLKDVSSAKLDFRRALETDPTDIAIAETILRMARPHDPAACRSAALALLASPRFFFSTHAAAVDILLRRSTPVVAQARLADETLEGWVTWTQAERVRVRLACADSHVEFMFEADPQHALATDSRRAANFSRLLPSGALPKLTWFLDREETPTKAWSQVVSSPSPSQAYGLPANLIGSAQACCVIVPLYDDPGATERCLESLSRQRFDGSMRIILVLDRPDDADMTTLSKRAADRFGFTLLINPANLGFVESVKRGLAAIRDCEDILLLNADTLLPDDAIQRLCLAAHSRREIGTVTPLSNNGEVTSFPRPFKAHAISGIDRVQQIDSVARQVNEGAVVTIQNGVGFCLYVKRSCFDAIGSFPDVYQRGYFEDVEFCLRARERGFVNVCATNIFVGHLGSRSFKAEKKALVASNAKILRSRFPNFISEGLASLRQDPLRSARRAIAFALPDCPPACRLIVASAPSFAFEHRADVLRRSGKPVLTLLGTKPSNSSQASLSSIGFDLHHDTRIDLADASERDDLIAYLRTLDLFGVELIDRPDFDTAFSSRLIEAFPCRTLLDRAPDFPAPKDDGDGEHVGASDKLWPSASSGRSYPSRSRPLALNAMMSAALHHHRIAHDIQQRARMSRPPASNGTALGIPYPEAHAAGDALLRRIAAKSPGLEIVVLGHTFSDAKLMSYPDVVVVGAVDHKDYVAVLDRCRIAALFSPDRKGSFSLMDWLSRSTGRPAAYFDWSYGQMAKRAGDLSLNPALVDDEAVDRLLAWCETWQHAGEVSRQERGEVVDVLL